MTQSKDFDCFSVTDCLAFDESVGGPMETALCDI